MDPYAVDLGIFEGGRPRLEPGVGFICLPVFDEMPSTVIAYSLCSAENEKQFKEFSKVEVADVRRSERAQSSSGDDTYAGGEPGPINSKNRSNTKSSDQPFKSSSASRSTASPLPPGSPKDIERRMLVRNKSHASTPFATWTKRGNRRVSNSIVGHIGLLSFTRCARHS